MKPSEADPIVDFDDFPPGVDCVGCNDEGITDRKCCNLCERGRWYATHPLDD